MAHVEYYIRDDWAKANLENVKANRATDNVYVRVVARSIELDRRCDVWVVRGERDGYLERESRIDLRGHSTRQLVFTPRGRCTYCARRALDGACPFKQVCFRLGKRGLEGVAVRKGSHSWAEKHLQCLAARSSTTQGMRTVSTRGEVDTHHKVHELLAESKYGRGQKRL